MPIPRVEGGGAEWENNVFKAIKNKKVFYY